MATIHYRDVISEREHTLIKTVFTNGCFDLLHAGHVELLERARSFGDRLVVGLNSDASVRRLKGPGRPIIPECQRLRMLRALTCVDQVILFDDDTPDALVKMLRPHTLVKGADWAGKPLAGQDYVQCVRFVPLALDVSTTTLLERIRVMS